MRHISIVRLPLPFLFISLLTLSSCFDKGCIDPMASNYDSLADRDDGNCKYAFATDETKDAFAENYALIAHAMYQDAYAQSEAMRELIHSFVANPTIPGLQACKDAWVIAHIPYSQAEVLQFPGSPVRSSGGVVLHERINAWNFTPAHIDYVKDSLEAGIINQAAKYPQIDAALLQGLNNTVDGKRITLGYHVIEFLLWGEDKEAVDELSSGKRSFKDYDTSDTNVVHAARRGQYLSLSADQLSNDLASLVNGWSPLGGSNYLKTFQAYSAKKQTRLAITGMVLFGQYELAQNRLLTTLTGLNPEREESTFSDNTQRDVFFNVLGLNSLFRGRYGMSDSTYIEGASLYDVIAEQDSSSANQLDVLMRKVMKASKEVMSPYDYQVSLEQAAGLGPITDLTVSLEAFGERLTEVAAELNMGIQKDLPLQD
ncbi:MAG: hypothetical protein HQ500_05230 [Flavobacteriales bacterium]|nr:hypothetical protein [Flavobacteriales bacterium]